MSIAAVNQRRSEAMKAYWSHIHDLSARKGIGVKEVRHSFVGKLSPPTQLQNHFTGRRYHYVFKKSHRDSYATVASDRPLTPSEARERMATIYNTKGDEYHEEGILYEEGDFAYQKHLSTIDHTITLEGEARTYDFFFEDHD